MQIPVLIESVPGSGYRASSAGPSLLSAEGATQDEALGKLQELIESRVAAGARFVFLQVPSAGQAPWAPFAGMLRDDPMLDAWKQAMAEYRQQCDAAPDTP